MDRQGSMFCTLPMNFDVAAISKYKKWKYLHCIINKLYHQVRADRNAD